MHHHAAGHQDAPDPCQSSLLIGYFFGTSHFPCNPNPHRQPLSMVKAPIGRARLHALVSPCFHESTQVPHEPVFPIGPPPPGKIPILPLPLWNHMFLNFDAMPPPLRGAARRPPALRPAGTVPPDRAALAAAGMVLGGHGASIEARFHRARHLVPAKADTVSRRPGPAGGGGTQSLKARNPSKSATSQGTQSLSPQSVKVRNLSRHAIRQNPQSVKVRIRGGDRRPDWAGGMVPPIGGAKPPGKGQAQNRRRPCCPPARSGRRDGAARLGGTGNGACNCRHGMVPPIGGTVPGGTGYGAGQLPGTKYGAARHGAANRRHGVWCLQLQARYMVPAKAGTENGAANRRHGSWRRGFGPPGTVRRLADRVGRAADRNWGLSGRGCGAWECGCPGTRSPGTRSPGMRSLGMRMSWSMRGPGMRSLGEMRNPGTARRPDWAGGKRCRPVGRHGSGGG